MTRFGHANPQKISINWASSGILVFAATVLSYAMAYCFELGYLSRYKVDSSVISISVQQLFAAALVLFVVIVATDVLLTFGKAIVSWSRSENVLARAGLLVTVLTVILGVLVILYANDTFHTEYPLITYPLLGIGYITFNLLLFSRALFLGHKFRNYRKGLEQSYSEADQARAESQRQYSNYSLLKLSILPRILLPVLLIIALGLCYAGAGYATADFHNHDVTVISHKGQSVEFIVSQFGDAIVVKNYNVTTHMLDEGYALESAVGHQYKREFIACTESFKSQSPKDSPAVIRCPR